MTTPAHDPRSSAPGGLVGPPARTAPFDARPLTEPVDRAEAKRLHEELKRRYPAARPHTATIVVFALVGGVFLLVGVPIVITMISVASSMARSGFGFGAVTLLPGLFVVAAIVFIIARQFGGANKERRYRLHRFAQANAMTYLPVLNAPKLPGMIFRLGSQRRATDLLRGERPRFVEFANYRYTTGSGKDSKTHTWGYVAIHLDTPLPHIVLDARGNNSLFGSNLPATFDRGQRLSLEGDFDRHFTLYCPQGYERDALYLFTPDIMARFMDNAGQLDVEIVDDWLFLYTKRQVSTTDPATWAWLFSVVSALMDKLAQWGRWRDERLAAAAGAVGAHSPAEGGAAGLPVQNPALVRPPKGVARPGQRLQRGVSWGSVIAIGMAVLFWLLQVFGSGFDLLGR
ncbi:hypothetical protein [Microbacterium album]|uniref:DUF3137 domain-containing protein n=1 Tax=Microbacterium album TaxID=2053191 RepID=A0A917IJX9_9MICO|nr:hypothetical protein [Microbacterium album]GGH51327.1 hypothetical protein GCM10010921_30680 [Microbacterium album]